MKLSEAIEQAHEIARGETSCVQISAWWDRTGRRRIDYMVSIFQTEGMIAYQENDSDLGYLIVKARRVVDAIHNPPSEPDRAAAIADADQFIESADSVKITPIKRASIAGKWSDPQHPDYDPENAAPMSPAAKMALDTANAINRVAFAAMNGDDPA